MTFVDGRPGGLHRGRRARREGRQPRRRGVARDSFPASSTATPARRRCRRATAIPTPPTIWCRSKTRCGRAGSTWARTFCCADTYVMNGGATRQHRQRVQRADWRLRGQTAVGLGPGERQDRQGRLVPRSAEGVPDAAADSELHRHLRPQPVPRERRPQRRPAVRRERDQQDGEGRAGVEPARHRPRAHRPRPDERRHRRRRPSSCSSATTRCSSGRRRTQFQQWTWDQSLKALPSIVTRGAARRDADSRAWPASRSTSPSFNAPTRYFDNLVLRYRTPLEGLRARVVWSYDPTGDFSDELSMTDADRARRGARDRADPPARQPQVGCRRRRSCGSRCSSSRPTGVVAEASPGGAPTSSDQFTISYVVFDRDAFSDTFERPR